MSPSSHNNNVIILFPILILNMQLYHLVHSVECPNDSATKCNLQKGKFKMNKVDFNLKWSIVTQISPFSNSLAQQPWGLLLILIVGSFS